MRFNTLPSSKSPLPACKLLRATDPPAEDEPLLPELAGAYYERRKAKGITEVQALEALSNPLWFGAMQVQTGHGDGMVAGALNTTAETVRACLQAIGAAKGIKTVSSFFMMTTRTHLSVSRVR